MASNGTPRVSGPLSGEQLAEIRARITASNSDSGVSSGQTTPARTAAAHSGLHMPKSGHYEAKESIPNTPFAASVISVALGAVAGIAATCAFQPVLRWLGEVNWTWARPQLGIYLTAWATFHILEFWTTAGWNLQKLSVDGEYPGLNWQLTFSVPPEQYERVPYCALGRSYRTLALVVLLAREVQLCLCLPLGPGHL